MNYYTLAELKSILSHGDWLIPEGKSVAMQVNINGDPDLPVETIELCEDWCKSYPVYGWDSPQKFAHIPQQKLEAATTELMLDASQIWAEIDEYTAYNWKSPNC